MNFCEFDKYATKSYCAIHNVDESKNLGDITKVDENKIDDFTMMTWGFPCTDISPAGKQKGFIDENGEKTRSGMYYEGIRILRAKKPKFSIIENVKALTSKKFKAEFEMILQDLDDAGYNSYWKVLNAKNYGIPQNRERVFIISIRKDLDNGKFEFPEPINYRIKLKDILEDEVEEKFYLNSKVLKNLKLFPDFKESDIKVCGTLNTEKKYQDRVRILDIDGISQSLRATDYKDPVKIKQIGNICENNNWSNPQRGRIYSVEGSSPTINTCSGGGLQPKIIVKNNKDKIKISQATKQGYIECEVGGVADLSYPTSKTRQGRVQENGNISLTITATEPEIHKIESNFRIRKLTPKEYFRLMGFSDEAFNRAKSVGISNTQLYKQAGNSIVVDVLYYIYRELYKTMPYLFDNLKLSSFFSGIGAFEIALNRLYESINSGILQNHR